MKAWLCAVGLCGGIATSAVAAAAAEPPTGLPQGQASSPRADEPISTPQDARPSSLFISPCGRPFRAGPDEAYPVAVWFAAADTNHDGALDRSEFRADAISFFSMLDSNHNGVIEPAEITFYEQRIVPEIVRGQRMSAASDTAQLILVQMGGGGGMGGHGGGQGKHHSATSPPSKGAGLSEMGGAAPYGLLAEPEPVTAADTDFNGRITPAEFLAAADRRFALLDTNGDRKLTLAELPPTAVQRLHGRSGAARRRHDPRA
jgi:hypothetical protein